MIFMRMGDEDGEKIAPDFLDEGDIGKDDIDARQIEARKTKAAIDHNPFARFRRAVAIKGEIHADLADAAKRGED